MNTSQFMDKQIMDLSNSNQSNNNEFINFMNPREDHHHHVSGGDKNEEILPNYDFQPIRPIVTSSSPPSDFSKVATVAAAHRTWNSADNKSSPRNYSSFDSFEPSKVILEKDHNAVDPTLVSEIDRTVKKYADNLLHSLDGISARLSQLESRTRHLEHSVDELKVSVGNNYGSSDRRMRQLENILREVQDGVQVVREKQEILDAHLQLAKLQSSKVGEHPDNQSAPHLDSSQPAISAPQQSHQQPLTVPFTQPPPSLPPPNAPPPPPYQQNLLPQVQPQNQFSPNPVPSVPQQEPYFLPPGQAPETVGQHYQVPPPPQIQDSSPAPPQQQYPPPQPQYSQPPPPPQQQPPVLAGNLPQQQPPLGHHHEESPFAQPPSYPPPHIRQSSSHPPTASPPPQQFYGAPPSNVYESPPSSRPGPGFSAPYGPSSGSPEPYPYSSSPSQYGSSFPMKHHQVSSPGMGHSGGSSYPQLPTARLLPHVLPTAAGVGGGSGSSGSGNRVPIDDVVDKVTSMGFSREQVRATVRKLTDSGQSVDLNVVLDTMMNDSDVQPPRGWYGR